MAGASQASQSASHGVIAEVREDVSDAGQQSAKERVPAAKASYQLQAQSIGNKAADKTPAAKEKGDNWSHLPASTSLAQSHREEAKSMELGSHGKEQNLRANNLMQLLQLPRGGHPRESDPPISIVHLRNHDAQPLSALSTVPLHDSTRIATSKQLSRAFASTIFSSSTEVHR